RPDRALPCDCERTQEPSLAQTLYRMADPAVVQRLGAAVDGAKGKGRLAKLLAGGKPTDEGLDELFLATLSRLPTRAEKAHFAAHRSGRERACRDALWALLNTREFLLNH